MKNKLTHKELVQMKIDECNSCTRNEFLTTCRSCTSYSCINHICRITGEFLPLRCAMYVPVPGIERKPSLKDMSEIYDIVDEEREEKINIQLKLF